MAEGVRAGFEAEVVPSFEPSNDRNSNQMNVKKKNKRPNKPSVVTLEQIITEKLRIGNERKQESNQKSSKVNKSSRSDKQSCLGLNALDSSVPSKKRGKEREIPKPKRPTTLKKIITDEKSGKNISEPDLDLFGNSLDSSENFRDLQSLNKKLIHNKSYREYCDQRLGLEIDRLVIRLLQDLVLFQDRMFLRDPIKAQIRRRLCFGFKEVTKYAKINKLKLLVIAPDIEKIESKGGLDDCLSNLIALCNINECPIVFALSRQTLGSTCKKKGIVSCVGVLNYDGTQVFIDTSIHCFINCSIALTIDHHLKN